MVVHSLGAYSVPAKSKALPKPNGVTPPTYVSSRVEIALAHARRGRRVFPFQKKEQGIDPATGDKKSQKIPLISNGHLGATTDEEQIREWWQQWPSAWAGWHIEDDLVVADKDNEKLFLAWCAETSHDLPTDGPWQKTPRSATSKHYLFKTDGRLVAQRAPFVPGLDTRTSSGWVGLYGLDAFDGEPALAPEWMYEVSGKSTSSEDEEDTEPSLADEAIADGELHIPMGGRDNALTSLAGSLARAFTRGGTAGGVRKALQLILASGAVEQTREDPITPQDIHRISMSVTSIEDRRATAEDTQSVALIVPRGQGRPDPMDPMAYHGLAADIVGSLQGTTEASEESLLMTFLVGFGALCGPSREVYLGGHQRANLFAALVGPSYHGRKGTSYSAIRPLLNAADPAFDHIVIPGVESGQGAVALLKKREADPTNDYRSMVYEVEFGRLFAAIGRDGSSVSHTMRAAFDGTQLGRTVVAGSILVTKHYVGTLAHITASELHISMNDNESRNGFGNRFLWSWSERYEIIPHASDPYDATVHLISEVQDSIRAAGVPGVLKMSKAANEMWEELCYEAPPKRTGLVTSLTDRKTTHVAKLALVYALLDRSDIVGPQHFLAAMAVWDYCERSAWHIFGDSTGSPIADALRAYLRDDAEGKWVSQKTQMDDMKISRPPLKAAQEILIREGLIETGMSKTGERGRPALVARSTETS